MPSLHNEPAFELNTIWVVTWWLKQCAWIPKGCCAELGMIFIAWDYLGGYVQVLQNFDALCVNCASDSYSDGDDGVDFPTLDFNCSYEGVIYVSLCFDGLVRESIMCECLLITWCDGLLCIVIYRWNMHQLFFPLLLLTSWQETSLQVSTMCEFQRQWHHACLCNTCFKVINDFLEYFVHLLPFCSVHASFEFVCEFFKFYVYYIFYNKNSKHKLRFKKIICCLFS